jgi:glutamate dehydrogenase
MGGTFVVDISEKTGVPPVDIARAYIIAREVFAVRDAWRDIEAQDGVVPAAVQGSLHREVQRLIEHGTLWFLRNGGTPLDISANVAAFEQPLAQLSARLADVLPEKIKRRIADRAARWQAQGVPPALAERIADLTVLPSACDIIRIASTRGIEAEDVARLHFSIGQQLGFGWLRDSAQNLSAAGYWQRLAVSAMVEELYAHQRDLTLKVLAASAEAGDGAFEVWSRPRQSVLDRSRALLTELEAAKEVDLSMLAVASRQLRALTET